MKIEVTGTSVKTGKKEGHPPVYLPVGGQMFLYDNAAFPFGVIHVISKDHILIHFKMDEPRVEEKQEQVVPADLIPLTHLRP